jgi:hypothetical protein
VENWEHNVIPEEQEKMPDQVPRVNQLESLLVEEGEQAVDSLLREALEPFVAFSKSGRMVTKPEFLKLSHQNQILVALLGRHAMVRLKLPGATLEASAETLQSDCLVPLKSAREHLSRSKARRLLEKNATGYFIPMWALSNVASLVKKNA